MKKISILITDDHKLLRQVWTSILNAAPQFNVVADTASGEEAIELSRNLKPDVVLMDINLPGMNGLDAIPLIRKYSPNTRVLGVSLHTQPAFARKAIKAGALGYVTKNSPAEELIEAIFEVQQNRKYICSEIRDILADQMLSDDEEKSGLDTLSCREMDIINYIKKGMSSKEIGMKLDITPKTVEVHRYNIMKKLRLKNVASLVNFINNNGLSTNN